MGILTGIHEERPVRLRDLPVAEPAPVVIGAGSLTGKDLRKAPPAVVLRTPAPAPVPAAGGELRFGQLVLDQPQAQLSLVVVAGNRQVGVRPGDPALVVQAALRLVPELDAVAVVQFRAGQRGEVGLERREVRIRRRVQQHGQEQVDVGGLRTRHVVEIGMDAEWIL